MVYKTGPSLSGDFGKEEIQERFQATLRGALKTPPQPNRTKQTEEAVQGHASAATAKTGRREA